jgi:hypothetical protein
MKVPVLLACSAAIATANAAWAADEATLAALEKLEPAIRTMVSGGEWNDGGQEGFFRLILISDGWEHVGHRAVLQWVAINQDNRTLAVAKSVPIKEMPSTAWNVARSEFKERGGKWQIQMSGRPVYEGKPATLSITPGPSFSYTFTATPAKK